MPKRRKQPSMDDPPMTESVYECRKCGTQIKRKAGQGDFLLKLEISCHIKECENPIDRNPLGYLCEETLSQKECAGCENCQPTGETPYATPRTASRYRS